MCRIVIIGGGFCGAMVSVHLARMLPTGSAATIDVVEPRPMLGGGVAYSAADPAHRINVPAARMTVFRDDPLQFERWCRRTGVLRDDVAAVWADGNAYPQRGVFGRYVAELVADATAARPELAMRHRRTRVVDVVAHAAGYTLRLGQGEALEADIVVLAVSHPPPAVPGVLQGVHAAGGPVIIDPWRVDPEVADPGSAADGRSRARRIPRDAAVLVVGTGLTMADVVAALARQDHGGPILAVSRRGLLSRGHAVPEAEKSEWFKTAPAPPTALGLARAVRRQVALARQRGETWHGVLDDVRSHAGRLWQALPVAEQRRVIRHLRPFWDVHRFRVAPQLAAAIHRLRETGQLRAMAASLVAARWEGGQIEVTLRRRGGGSAALLCHAADVVVVTTGPAHGSALALNPALAALAAQGLVQADPAGLGIAVDADSRPLGRDGVVRRDLLVVGPLARGRFGELMGLPQVSEHAETVAAEVTHLVAERSHAEGGPWPQPY